MQDSSKKLVLIFLVTALTLFFGGLIADKASAMCGTTYDYPGCTFYQTKKLEGGTEPRIATHYPKARWGQSHHEYRGMPPRVNRHLRHEYNQAVNRYINKRTNALQTQGLEATPDRVQPKFMTWRGFKSNTACFGYWSAFYSSWCAATIGAQQGLDWTLTRDVQNFSIKCGGYIFSGAVAGGATAAAVPTGVAIAPGALAGATGGAAACVADSIWYSLWG